MMTKENMSQSMMVPLLPFLAIIFIIILAHILQKIINIFSTYSMIHHSFLPLLDNTIASLNNARINSLHNNETNIRIHGTTTPCFFRIPIFGPSSPMRRYTLYDRSLIHLFQRLMKCVVGLISHTSTTTVRRRGSGGGFSLKKKQPFGIGSILEFDIMFGTYFPLGSHDGMFVYACPSRSGWVGRIDPISLTGGMLQIIQVSCIFVILMVDVVYVLGLMFFVIILSE
mmetsp:Transcript_685/g.1092  ORF Transcript_685/g.1092 Transcript_685/m.1092 type:complete len:227 (+) Transcript_685:1150-1830(+)